MGNLVQTSNAGLLTDLNTGDIIGRVADSTLVTGNITAEDGSFEIQVSGILHLFPDPLGCHFTVDVPEWHVFANWFNSDIK